MERRKRVARGLAFDGAKIGDLPVVRETHIHTHTFVKRQTNGKQWSQKTNHVLQTTDKICR